MKLLINTSTLSSTGVTQVSVSFIKECVIITGNEYHVLLSKTVSFFRLCENVMTELKKSRSEIISLFIL